MQRFASDYFFAGVFALMMAITLTSLSAAMWSVYP